MSINFNINSQFSTGSKKSKKKRGLTPQEEYWLDRILRNHSGQIFMVIILFLILMIGSMVVAFKNGKVSGEKTNFSVIEIKTSK